MLTHHVDSEKLIRHANHHKKETEVDGFFNIPSKRKNPGLHAPAYGARFYSEPIPKFTMPQESMPANVAYQLVHDEMQLDGNPTQNMATFVTTWMEPEAQSLSNETITKNFADCDEYPQTQEIHQRCVSIISHLFHAPTNSDDRRAYGTCTIGSSEAIMLAGLSHKFRWRNMRKEKGLPTDKPNAVFGSNAQVCLEKFAVYFDVERRQVPVTVESNFVISVEDTLKLVDENTVVVMAILGSTFTGHFEPIKKLNDALQELNKKNGWDVGIHVDAASGGFVAPFLYPDLEWDFRLPLVRSINVSGHKYGLVYPGLGWCIWRSKEFLPEELIFHINYLGGNFPTFTLNFSRNSSTVISQYYNFLRLGFNGYKSIIENCQKNASFLTKCLADSHYFKIRSDCSKNLPLVAFSLANASELSFNEYDLMHTLRQKGWIVPAYNLPKDVKNINVLRVVIRESHSEDLLEHLVSDCIWAYETLRDQKNPTTQTKKEEKEKEKGKEKEGGEKDDKGKGKSKAGVKRDRNGEEKDKKKGKKHHVARHGIC